MVRRSRSRGVLVALAVAFAGMMSACDPAATVHFVRKDFEPVRCDHSTGISYTVHIRYRDGDTFEDRFEIDPDAGHPTAGVLPGSIERQISWIRCELYCGDGAKPFHVTPNIPLPDGLEKKDDWNYTYTMEGYPATHPKGGR